MLVYQTNVFARSPMKQKWTRGESNPKLRIAKAVFSQLALQAQKLLYLKEFHSWSQTNNLRLPPLLYPIELHETFFSIFPFRVSTCQLALLARYSN